MARGGGVLRADAGGVGGNENGLGGFGCVQKFSGDPGVVCEGRVPIDGDVGLECAHGGGRVGRGGFGDENGGGDFEGVDGARREFRVEPGRGAFRLGGVGIGTDGDGMAEIGGGRGETLAARSAPDECEIHSRFPPAAIIAGWCGSRVGDSDGKYGISDLGFEIFGLGDGRYTGGMEARSEMGRVRVGPAGWSYDDWKGIVYPADMPKKVHALEVLSGWFDTVEINVTFYRTVSAGTSRGWVEKVARNAEFRFAAKAWRRFTHDEAEGIDEGELREFRLGIDPLMEAGRLGAVLLQYPWSFRRTAANRRRLAETAAALGAYPLAVEVRHDSWLCDEYLAGLRAQGIAFCNIDQPEHGHGIEPTAYATGRVGYVRLHGRNQQAWFNDTLPSYERYNYLYGADELRPWVDRIVSIAEQADETYVVTNNHFQGKAVANAFEILAALGRPPRALPEELTAAYPRLRAMIAADAGTGVHGA